MENTSVMEVTTTTAEEEEPAVSARSNRANTWSDSELEELYNVKKMPADSATVSFGLMGLSMVIELV